MLTHYCFSEREVNLIPDVSQMLSWLEANPNVLQGIRRGIERETLRITADGGLAMTDHPKSLGAALTHQWITTDFAEAMLEFITPVNTSIDHLLDFLRDLHRYSTRQLGEETLWPLSMPSDLQTQHNIEPAKYGASNLGRFKNIYRAGLKNRYGALMQIISGVHYNFSLPTAFWQHRTDYIDEKNSNAEISAGYFRLIRNYHRFGWLIPYLFGASPAICSSFLNDKKTSLVFERKNGSCYLPYATSLRLSDLGYSNKSQHNLAISFNDLTSYVDSIKWAVCLPSKEFSALGLKKGEDYLQLNTNLLQTENELYAPIRPKRVSKAGEAPSDALLRGGVEYIEVRSLDINPFSPIGIDATQVRFLDLFLIWCALADAPTMNNNQLVYTGKNWQRVILAGRKPGQTLFVGWDSDTKEAPLSEIGKALFNDLRRIASLFDHKQRQEYQQVCDELVSYFDDPTLTFSARVLQEIQQKGINEFALSLAERHRHTLKNESFRVMSEKQLSDEREASWQRQYELERTDTLSFAQYLSLHGGGR
ncbi:gamma-glutamylcysteine synthetase [Candidatus Regiella insecticola LSR1]|uniref:Glutamate--cysteine ligase n=1 Tax=Candidatus Regiella insecticola LSR1 TaxID=663321 RepID=E0WQS8_9ENTR|nr:glutamate--cysteine ligase [Candidatus Regiella insecticola]EFL92488.1 gamma-glutamylcysteine synthetase [Candidatus Regiella insecticola LSR1]